MNMREFASEEMSRAIEEIESGGEIIPRFIARDVNNETYMIATPWGDEKEKLQTFSLLKIFFAYKQITQYVMISEAWAVTIKADPEKSAQQVRKEFLGDMQPSEHPDREEVLVAQGISHEEQFSVRSTIKRFGDKVECTKPEFLEVDSTGRINGILPPEDLGPPPPHLKKKLEQMFSGLEKFIEKRTLH